MATGLKMVTVKLPKNPNHDPQNKVTGPCPVGFVNTQCTDVTGEHHTLLVADEQVSSLKARYHITRIEDVQ